MKPKTTKILYWVVTLLFAAFMLFSGITSFWPNEMSVAMMTHLGYPFYMFYILGAAKILGVIGILQTKFRTLKEWAYAGFTIDIIGASASFLLVGDGIAATLFPLVFLAVMFASYFLGKKVEKLGTTEKPAKKK